MGNQWGTFTFASPNQNVGGCVSPVPPIIAAPTSLRSSDTLIRAGLKCVEALGSCWLE